MPSRTSPRWNVPPGTGRGPRSSRRPSRGAPRRQEVPVALPSPPRSRPLPFPGRGRKEGRKTGRRMPLVDRGARSRPSVKVMEDRPQSRTAVLVAFPLPRPKEFGEEIRHRLQVPDLDADMEETRHERPPGIRLPLRDRCARGRPPSRHEAYGGTCPPGRHPGPGIPP